MRNGRKHRVGGLFKKRNGLSAGHGREIFQELVQRIAAFEVIQQRPHRHARAGKTRFATHDFRINFDNAICLHANN